MNLLLSHEDEGDEGDEEDDGHGLVSRVQVLLLRPSF